MSRQKKGDPIAELRIRIVDYKDEKLLSPLHQRAGQDPARAVCPASRPGTSASSRWPSSGPGILALLPYIKGYRG